MNGGLPEEEQLRSIQAELEQEPPEENAGDDKIHELMRTFSTLDNITSSLNSKVDSLLSSLDEILEGLGDRPDGLGEEQEQGEASKDVASASEVRPPEPTAVEPEDAKPPEGADGD